MCGKFCDPRLKSRCVVAVLHAIYEQSPALRAWPVPVRLHPPAGLLSCPGGVTRAPHDACIIAGVPRRCSAHAAPRADCIGAPRSDPLCAVVRTARALHVWVALRCAVDGCGRWHEGTVLIVLGRDSRVVRSTAACPACRRIRCGGKPSASKKKTRAPLLLPGRDKTAADEPQSRAGGSWETRRGSAPPSLALSCAPTHPATRVGALRVSTSLS